MILMKMFMIFNDINLPISMSESMTVGWLGPSKPVIGAGILQQKLIIFHKVLPVGSYILTSAKD